MPSARTLCLGIALACGARWVVAQSTFVPILKPSTPASAPSAIQPVTSQRVAFAGSMGSRQALLVIDGAAPRALTVGDSWRGVKLLAVNSTEVVIELDRVRHTLRMGAAAVDLGGAATPGTGNVIKLTGDANGHFLTSGLVNGRVVSVMVDTGASLVSIGQQDADRLQIAYRTAPRVALRTANGEVTGYRVTLDSVRLGDVEVYNIDAVVQPQSLPFILLGNSFLRRFQLRLENDVLTLDRR